MRGDDVGRFGHSKDAFPGPDVLWIVLADESGEAKRLRGTGESNENRIMFISTPGSQIMKMGQPVKTGKQRKTISP
jgi:hypothetical protein